MKQSQVHGIVLAGVHAWGACELERAGFRPLLPIAGRPLIAHVMQWLAHGGAAGVTVCGNGATRKLKDGIGSNDALGLPVQFMRDDPLRGPGGCALEAAFQCDSETVVLVYGTILPRLDLDRLLGEHRESGNALTVVVRRYSAGAAGDAESAGIYVARREALAGVTRTGYRDLKEDVIPALREGGHSVGSSFIDQNEVGRVLDFRSYLAVNRWALERMAAKPCPPGFEKRGDGCIAAGSQVADSARFVGPVWVGPGSRIEDNVLIVGPTAIGEGAIIESGAVVSRSVGWDRCRVGAGAEVDQCVLAVDAIVEAECVIRNTVCVTPRDSRRSWFGSWGRRGRASQGSGKARVGVHRQGGPVRPRRP